MSNPWGKMSVKLHQQLGFSKRLKAFSITSQHSEKSVFFPGCALMAHSPELVQQTFTYLKSILPSVEMMSACCGKPTAIMGEHTQYAKNLNSLELQLQNAGVKQLIVACMNCYAQFKKAYDNIEVISLWELMVEHGISKETHQRLEHIDIAFSLHDPCPARNEDHIHEAVRRLLSEMPITYVEFKANRSQSLCCGAGNMLLALNPKAGQKLAHKRASQSPTYYVVTYCQSCVETFRTTDLTSVHLLELIFNENIRTKEDLDLKTKSLLQKWQNRFAIKKHIEQL